MAETAENADAAVDPEDENTEKYLIFSILNRFYSFPSRCIGEIALYDTVYPLPLMPFYVLGVVNRYSIPYALFDTGLLLHNAPCKKKKMLVLKEDIDRIAFLIDDVTDIADIRQDAACSSFEWNGNNVSVLDIGQILERVKENTEYIIQNIYKEKQND
jgi:purine-binding chemotaxis protein CheW